MTRQSKSAKLKIQAKQITELHKKGEKGPKKTTPKHGKDSKNRLYTSMTRGEKDRKRNSKKKVVEEV